MQVSSRQACTSAPSHSYHRRRNISDRPRRNQHPQTCEPKVRQSISATCLLKIEKWKQHIHSLLSYTSPDLSLPAARAGNRSWCSIRRSCSTWVLWQMHRNRDCHILPWYVRSWFTRSRLTVAAKALENSDHKYGNNVNAMFMKAIPEFECRGLPYAKRLVHAEVQTHKRFHEWCACIEWLKQDYHVESQNLTLAEETFVNWPLWKTTSLLGG